MAVRDHAKVRSRGALAMAILALCACCCAAPCLAAKHWDTDEDIQGNVEEVDIVVPIWIPSETPRLTEPVSVIDEVDRDHWVIENEQGEEIDEGWPNDLIDDSTVSWDTPYPASIDPNGIQTTWRAASSGGEYWIQAWIDDDGELPAGDTGSRNDDPLTYPDIDRPTAIAVEVVLDVRDGPGDLQNSSKSFDKYEEPHHRQTGLADPSVPTEHSANLGFRKRVEIVGRIIPESLTEIDEEDAFKWFQQIKGEITEDWSDWEDFPDPPGPSPFNDWTDDEAQPVWGDVVFRPELHEGKPYVYLIDNPGWPTGGWEGTPEESHQKTFSAVGGGGPFRFRTRVKFKDQWCVTEWKEWTFHLVIESNIDTIYRWSHQVEGGKFE